MAAYPDSVVQTFDSYFCAVRHAYRLRGAGWADYYKLETVYVQHAEVED